MEATYLYPLPDDGAVDSMKMVVGDRIFIGRIERRAQARADYEKARAEGRKAGLVEAERPNLFRNDVAVGGAAYLVAKAIKSAKVVGFADLGMEAIYEFEVKDMPVTVAVDSAGTSVHETGPKIWKGKIAGIPVVSA